MFKCAMHKMTTSEVSEVMKAARVVRSQVSGTLKDLRRVLVAASDVEDLLSEFRAGLGTWTRLDR